MKTVLEPGKVSITLTPAAAPAPGLARCGLCARETYVMLTLSADHPECCRGCFRQRVAQVRRPALAR